MWEIRLSELSGRGVFATSDCPPGNVVFIDKPLVLGPKLNSFKFCVRCGAQAKLMCPQNCKLPVCSTDCANSEIHKFECDIISKISRNATVQSLLALVAPLRALQLRDDQRDVLKILERHESAQNDVILSSLNGILNSDDFDLVKMCCEVFDAVAYEAPGKSEKGLLRGIYPISGLLNHSCGPNTTHSFDSYGRMVVKTSKYVKIGEEFTTSYTPLLWGTESRRLHLKTTKRFSCNCARCLDPAEHGAQLMGLYCLRKACNGVLLPHKQFWTCGSCGGRMKNASVEIIHWALGSLMKSTLSSESPKVLSKILRRGNMVPNCNQLAVELKMKLIKIYGNEDGFKWKDLTDNEIKMKLLFCNELLLLFDVLRLGKLRLKEYLATAEELNKRNLPFPNSPFYSDLANLFKEAQSILKSDEAANKLLTKLSNGLHF